MKDDIFWAHMSYCWLHLILNVLLLRRTKWPYFHNIFMVDFFRYKKTIQIFYSAAPKNEGIEAATKGVLWKKVFLKILQNSQESTRAKVSLFIKFAGLIEHLWTIASENNCFIVIMILLLSVLLPLTYLWPMFPFYTPWKHQKTKGFLVFSGGIKWEHWPKTS